MALYNLWIHNACSCFLIAWECEGDHVWYKGWTDAVDGVPGCKPCSQGCSKEPVYCVMMCSAGCGCPPGLVPSPTDWKRCIKIEDCPPTGTVIFEISAVRFFEI